MANFWDNDAVLPTAPPVSRGRKQAQQVGGQSAPLSADDRKEASKWRSLSDDADKLDRAASDFNSRVDRFHPSAAKNALFEAMYPETDGLLGAVKGGFGAALRGTVGYLYPQQDHDDYQFLASRSAAINNAALRLEKGVQTDRDERRIARENVGLDKSSRVNRDIIHASDRNVAVAHARNLAIAQWQGAHGSLYGTRDANGATFEDWFQHTVLPHALATPHPSSPSRSHSGWSISR